MKSAHREAVRKNRDSNNYQRRGGCGGHRQQEPARYSDELNDQELEQRCRESHGLQAAKAAWHARETAAKTA